MQPAYAQWDSYSFFGIPLGFVIPEIVYLNFTFILSVFAANLHVTRGLPLFLSTLAASVFMGYVTYYVTFVIERHLFMFMKEWRPKGYQRFLSIVINMSFVAYFASTSIAYHSNVLAAKAINDNLSMNLYLMATAISFLGMSQAILYVFMSIVTSWIPSTKRKFAAFVVMKFTMSLGIFFAV
jgi:hypothetical protein